MTQHETREAWLRAACEELQSVFNVGKPLPLDKMRVSCGWPSKSATSSKSRRVGEAWSPDRSGDSTHEIFISPSLEDPMKVLGVLVHECAHAAVGVEYGHKGPFRKLALAVGLEGKMTATTIGPTLVGPLEVIAERLGDYPHAKLTPGETVKRNKNRHQKLVCRHCDFVCRASRGAVEKAGPPIHCMDEEMIWSE